MVHRSTLISFVVWVAFNTTYLSYAATGYSKRHYLIRLLDNWRVIKVQQFNEGQHGLLSLLLICPKIARNRTKLIVLGAFCQAGDSTNDEMRGRQRAEADTNRT